MNKIDSLKLYKDCLIIVDMVNGFVREGVLHDEEISKIIPKQIKLIKEAKETKLLIIFIKDIDFSRRRWKASTGVQYVHGLYTSVKPVAKDNFVLWNASVTFRATRWLDLFVRGENLLAQRYEINDGFPMPKATALGGMNVNF